MEEQIYEAIKTGKMFRNVYGVLDFENSRFWLWTTKIDPFI